MSYLEPLRSALGERPIYTLEDVEKEIAEGRSFFWSGEKAALVVSVNDHSTGERSLDCWLGAGNMTELMAQIEPIERWAKAAGCTQIHINGRKGWERMFAPHGYEPWTITLRKLL